MTRLTWGAAALAAAGLLCACGNSKTAENDGTPGQLRLALTGSTSGSGMATLVIRNVFDHTESYLVECQEKDHLLEGDVFCDELIVLPPGVYEVIVQSSTPGCRAEFEWYKVIVEPNETIELEIVLVCGGDANGGLDVIVRQTEIPVVTDIDFTFEDGDVANKFVCQNGEDVDITLTVTDPDVTDCSTLTGTWRVKAPGDTEFGADLTPPLVPGSATTQGAPGPDGTCVFTATVDASSPLGSYEVRLDFSDGQLGGYFTFPIHLIDCELTAACQQDLSNIGAGDFEISFDLTLPAANTGLYALLNQRATCAHSLFWDVRVANGTLFVETDDTPGPNYTILPSLPPPLNDGALHSVKVERLAGVLTIWVDGSPAGSAPSLSSFGALAPLAVGTDVCVGVDTTQPLPAGASLSNWCVRPLP